MDKSLSNLIKTGKIIKDKTHKIKHINGVRKDSSDCIMYSILINITVNYKIKMIFILFYFDKTINILQYQAL